MCQMTQKIQSIIICIIFSRKTKSKTNYKKEKLYFVFAHFAAAPWYKDNIILTLDPADNQDVYGIGQDLYWNKRKKELISKFWALKANNQWYYASNYVGEIIEDYEKNIKQLTAPCFLCYFKCGRSPEREEKRG